MVELVDSRSDQQESTIEILEGDEMKAFLKKFSRIWITRPMVIYDPDRPPDSDWIAVLYYVDGTHERIGNEYSEYFSESGEIISQEWGYYADTEKVGKLFEEYSS